MHSPGPLITLPFVFFTLPGYLGRVVALILAFPFSCILRFPFFNSLVSLEIINALSYQLRFDFSFIPMTIIFNPDHFRCRSGNGIRLSAPI